MAGDHDGNRYPLRTLTDADLTELIRLARVANPSHPSTEVEESPRDPQPARLTLGEP